jgi:hypothetical protein
MAGREQLHIIANAGVGELGQALGAQNTTRAVAKDTTTNEARNHKVGGDGVAMPTGFGAGDIQWRKYAGTGMFHLQGTGSNCPVRISTLEFVAEVPVGSGRIRVGDQSQRQ